MALEGCFPALVTPMRSNDWHQHGPINFDAFKEVIDYVIEGGVSGVVIAGCTGADSLISWAEQVQLVETAINHVGGRVPVIAGDGSNSPYEAIENAKRMEDLGIQHHLMISPYKVKPPMRGIIKHYIDILEEIKGDIIVYNVPGRTGSNITPETVIYLARNHERIAALKQANTSLDPDLSQTRQILEATKDLPYFSVLSGDDDRTLDMMRYGASGAISVVANVAPEKVSFYVKQALAGNYDIAAPVENRIKGLVDVLFLPDEGNPMCCHYALSRLGFAVGVPREPLGPVKPESAEIIDKALYDLALIKD